MTIQELFIRSNEELKKVIDQIRDDQWSIELPAGMSRTPSNLQQAVKYHIYDDAWVSEILIGKTIEEVGDVFEGLLLKNDNLKAEYATYNAQAIEAVRSYTDLDNTVHLSYGDFPAREYLQHITIFRTLRGYDIAKLLGIDSTMEPAFVQGLLAEYPSHLEQYRQFGIIPAAIPVSVDTSPQDQFLAMVGRV